MLLIAEGFAAALYWDFGPGLIFDEADYSTLSKRCQGLFLFFKVGRFFTHLPYAANFWPTAMIASATWRIGRRFSRAVICKR